MQDMTKYKKEHLEQVSKEMPSKANHIECTLKLYKKGFLTVGQCALALQSIYCPLPKQ